MFTIFTQDDCAYCERVKDLLHERYIDYREFNLHEDGNEVFMRIMFDLGHLTVPQVYDADGYYIGGYAEVKEHFDE